MGDKTILVTGASGFIGKPLAERLEQRGFTVVRHSADRGDIASCDLPKGADHVFHLAARTFVPDSWSAPMSFYATNVMGTVNVAEFCRRNSVSLTMMSSYVYGRPQFLPISETHPVAAFNPYSHSKLLAEEVCRYYAQQFNMRVTIIRPFNIYGPGQNGSFLIPTLLRQVLDQEAREISVADDRPRRDYLHVDELVDLLVLTMDPCGFEIFNAGSGRSISPRELAESMLAAVAAEKHIVSRGELRPDEVLETVADVGKARRVFGWEPHISLPDGIGRLINANRACGGVMVNK